eukprot:280524_1
MTSCVLIFLAQVVAFNIINVDCLNDATITSQRIDCYPESGASESNCNSRGCLWNTTRNIAHEPNCYYPNDWGYVLQSNTSKSYGDQYVIQQNKYKNPYGQDIVNVNIDVIYDTNNRVRIRMTDSSNPNRYTVPIPLPAIPNKKATNPIYSVTPCDNNNIFGLNISQLIDNKAIKIGSTALPGFTYSNQFIQFVFGFNSLLNISSYGWGSRYSDFNIPYNYTTLPLFSRSIVDSNSYQNSYGVHPFLISIDKNTGNSFGIFIVNSNAMELVTIPYPTALQYRSIGGIIDMFIFFGPKPADVISQYWDIIGKPLLPPLWSLGFHLCRYCYNSVNRTRYILEGMVNNKIPYDTQWNDIDYMDILKDFTYNHNAYNGLPQFVDDVHTKYDMRYINIVDPMISNATNYPPYTDGIKLGAFIKQSSGDILYGTRNGLGPATYPDHFNHSTKDYWSQQALNWKKIIDFDGWWLDLDEPSNHVDGSITGCPKSQYETPPYYPAIDSTTLAERTLCMTSIQKYGSSTTMHYNVHSLYGLSEVISTQYALNKTHNSTKRNFIISRSSYPTSGQYGGIWLGDNSAKYEDMQIQITDVIAYNMFGITMAGTDICGFKGNTTIELCSRWSALGSFSPFSRNHNGCNFMPQDPPSLGEPVISISRKYLQVRYEIMPYLYTLFSYDAHINSKTVARSLWLNEPFEKDMNVYDINDQYMLGQALLISPVLNKGAVSIEAYFPKTERWFEWFTFNELNKKGFVNIDAPLDVLPIHLRGGNILTLQNLNGSLTTKQQSIKPYQLLVALNNNNIANGNVYIDDGISIDSVLNNKYTLIQFTVSYNNSNLQYILKNNIVQNGYISMNNNGLLNEIKVVGLNGNINGIKSVNVSPNIQFKSNYNQTVGVLTLSQLTLTINKPFIVTFEVTIT